jgi:hypothetical protein
MIILTLILIIIFVEVYIMDKTAQLKTLIAEAIEENNPKILETLREQLKTARAEKVKDPKKETDVLDDFFNDE